LDEGWRYGLYPSRRVFSMPLPIEKEYDVIIVGAGISGIGAAYHLQTQCPGKRIVVLEQRSALGGTWDFFKYPGLRSDSDMFTFGYSFYPWNRSETLASSDLILAYLREVVAHFKLDRHIHYDCGVKSAAWDSATNQWTLETPQGTIKTAFMFMCSGYYEVPTRVSAGACVVMAKFGMKPR